jgi:hypothetical protein
MNRTPQRRAGPGLERGAELRSDVKNRNSNHLGRPRPVCTLTGGDESAMNQCERLMRAQTPSIQDGVYLSNRVARCTVLVSCRRFWRGDSGPIGPPICRISYLKFREHPRLLKNPRWVPRVSLAMP